MTFASADLEQFRAAFGNVLAQIRAFKQTLTPRDAAFIQFGMRTAHAREAAIAGDAVRATSHRNAMATLLGTSLRGPATRRERVLAQIGEESAHMEEAASRGDEMGGKAHLDALLALMASLPPR